MDANKEVNAEGEPLSYEDTLKSDVYGAMDKILDDNRNAKDIAERIKIERNSDKNSSLFGILQREIRDLEEMPQGRDRKKLVSKLKAVRDVLTNAADKDLHLWGDERGGLANYMSDAQHGHEWPDARRVIQRVDTEDIEMSMSINPYWSRDFRGMLDEYRDVALLNMDSAMHKALGEDDEHEALEEEIFLRGWGFRPLDLESLAQKHLESLVVQPEDEEEELTEKEKMEHLALSIVLALEGRDRITEPDFLKNEKWADYVYEFNPDRAPPFYREMTPERKEEFEARVRLHHAVYVKRKGSGGLSVEGIGKNEIMKEISNSQMDALWRIAGVKKGLAEYLKAIERDPNAVTYGDNGLYDIENERDANNFRAAVAGKIRSELQNEFIEESVHELAEAIEKSESVSPHEAQDKAIEVFNEHPEILENNINHRTLKSEQIAFNLHFLANAFESLQNGWEENNSENIFKEMEDSEGKQKKALLSSYFSQLPMMEEMRPLDTLIGAAFKEGEKIPYAGRLTNWAHQQLEESARRRRFSMGDDTISRTEIISNETNQRDMRRSWTVERYSEDGEDKWRLMVPQCYPIKTMGSYWEEIEKDDDAKKILKAIEEEEDIDWGSNKFTWLNYYLHAQKEANLVKAGMGEEVQHVDYVKGLAKREKKNDWRYIRWHLYASRGVDASSRLPRIQLADGLVKESFVDGYSKNLDTGGGVILRSELFFPWDDIRYGRRNRRFATE